MAWPVRIPKHGTLHGGLWSASLKEAVEVNASDSPTRWVRSLLPGRAVLALRGAFLGGEGRGWENMEP